MRKYLSFFALAMTVAMFSACSNDDDTAPAPTPELEESYITVENATYNAGAMPAATTDEAIDGIEMSTQVMNGAMNYVTITTEQAFSKFFIGMDGVDGYFEYVPEQVGSRADVAVNIYVIPIMVSVNFNGDATLVLSGQLDDGRITQVIERVWEYIETQPGSLEVKLAFSNDKDIDLHLYTPSGEHIYFANRGGTYWVDDSTTVTYGLDIDSNAGCNIDGINKENIYLPEELVENGTYTVVVDLWSNCDPSIATNWSIVTRYKGELIDVTTGTNPASGVYPVDAVRSDHTEVMTFEIHDATRAMHSPKLSFDKFTPMPLDNFAKMKIEEAKMMLGR